MTIDFNTLVKVKENIGDFHICQSFGSNELFLRFGYWRRVKLNILKECLGNSVKVEMDYFDDEDCGELYYYKIKNII